VHQLIIDFKEGYDSFRREVFCNVLIEFSIPMKLVRLIYETYSRVRIGKNSSDMFPLVNGLKQGDAVTPLLFNFALEYTIRRVKANQDGLKLDSIHQPLVYAGDVNLLGESVYTIVENADSLLVTSKEIGLDVIADKTKFMVLSRGQNAGRSQNIKTDNSPSERMGELK
jgi:hypothetical protein